MRVKLPREDGAPGLLSRVKERGRITASFVFTSPQGVRDPPKEANPESHKPPGRSSLTGRENIGELTNGLSGFVGDSRGTVSSPS